jgi:hypothetical protein
LESPFFVSASGVGGWITDSSRPGQLESAPGESRSENFLSGGAVNVSGGVGVGAGITQSIGNTDHGLEVGVYLPPQGSVSITGALKVDNNQGEFLWEP